jgi:hypothetical protein
VATQRSTVREPAYSWNFILDEAKITRLQDRTARSTLRLDITLALVKYT